MSHMRKYTAERVSCEHDVGGGLFSEKTSGHLTPWISAVYWASNALACRCSTSCAVSCRISCCPARILESKMVSAPCVAKNRAMRACCESIRASRLLDNVSVSRPRLGMCRVLHESGRSGPTVDAEAGRQAHVRCGVIRASQSRRVEKVARLFLCPCRGAHSVSTCISSCGHAVQCVARRHALSVRTHSRNNGISGMQVAPSDGATRRAGAAALRVRVCVCAPCLAAQ